MMEKSMTGKQILIVEDEKSLQLALKSKLEQNGYHIFQAFNGEDGLKILEKEKIDLIMLDIIMPVMDGMMMIKKIRQSEKFKNVRIIILTNSASYGTNFDFKEADYLIKSNYSLSEIVDKVKIMLGE